MQSIDLFLYILHLTTKTRGSFADEMFDHSSAVILRDDLLEVFVGDWYVRTKGGVGNGLRKLLVHDYVDLK